MALERGRLCSANVSMLIFFHLFLMCQLMKPFPVTDVLLILGCECHLGSGVVGDIRHFAVLLMSRVHPYHMPFQRFCHPSEATIG